MPPCRACPSPSTVVSTHYIRVCTQACIVSVCARKKALLINRMQDPRQTAPRFLEGQAVRATGGQAPMPTLLTCPPASEELVSRQASRRSQRTHVDSHDCDADAWESPGWLG